MSEQELNKKLAEWRKLKDFRIYADHAGNYYKIQFIDPEHRQMYIVCDAFHLSLDVCFKWLVPKVLGELKPVDILAYPTSGKYPDIGFHCELNGRARQYPTEAGTPALALCLAIEKLIDSGGEKK